MYLYDTQGKMLLLCVCKREKRRERENESERERREREGEEREKEKEKEREKEGGREEGYVDPGTHLKFLSDYIIFLTNEPFYHHQGGEFSWLCIFTNIWNC
jgi:hypothetical protein